MRLCGNLPAGIPHRMAYIRKYRDSWRAEVQRHGHRASFLAPTKREAQAWALKKELELDGLKRSKGLTFDQACQKYLANRKSAAWDERRLMEAAEFFGAHTMLAAIDSARIGEWRDERLKTVQPSTVLRHRNLLQGLFTVAVEEWKVIGENPFRGVRFPQHNPPRDKVWTWQEIRKVLRERERRTGTVIQTVNAFHISLHTGMRMKEIFSAKVVGKVAHLSGDKTSGGKTVMVPLARKGAELFAKYQPWTINANQASPLFSDLTDAIGIEGLTFHDARASALTWLSRRVDVMTLARISRHTNLKTLMNSYYRETAEQIAARL